ncbi:MAG: HutD family protein [Bacteroidota bacterium]|nr:HutD family protein [Bacteroidota bacterium]
MKTTLYNAEHYTQTKWEGGSVWQLYIYPDKSTYTEKNFSIRISRASIERIQSVFTSLPDIDRKLLVLEGALLIEHPARYTTLLLPYDTDTFQGDWNTLCKGTGADYNVMTKGNIQSSLNAIELEANEPQQIQFSAATKLLHFYAYRGNAVLTCKERQIEISEGMSFVIEDIEEEFEITLASNVNSVIIISGFEFV